MASVQEVWKALEDAIGACTGLSPAAFFTVVALAFVAYYEISGFYAQSSPSPRRREEMETLPPPVQLGELTEEQLKAYDGSDPKKPLLMAIKGQIYDVSQGRFSSVQRYLLLLGLCAGFGVFHIFLGFQVLGFCLFSFFQGFQELGFWHFCHWVIGIGFLLIFLGSWNWVFAHFPGVSSCVHLICLLHFGSFRSSFVCVLFVGFLGLSYLFLYFFPKEAKFLWRMGLGFSFFSNLENRLRWFVSFLLGFVLSISAVQSRWSDSGHCGTLLRSIHLPIQHVWSEI